MKTNKGRWPHTTEAVVEIMWSASGFIIVVFLIGALVAILVKIHDLGFMNQFLFVAAFSFIVWRPVVHLTGAIVSDIRRQREVKRVSKLTSQERDWEGR